MQSQFFYCLFLLYDGIFTQGFDIGFLLAIEALTMALLAIRFPMFWIGYALTSFALIGGDEIYWAPIFPASNIALLDTFSFSPKRLGPAVLIPTVINVFFVFIWQDPVKLEAIGVFSNVVCFSVAGILVRVWMERSFQIGRDEQAAREEERRNLNIRLHDNVLRTALTFCWLRNKASGNYCHRMSFGKLLPMKPRKYRRIFAPL